MAFNNFLYRQGQRIQYHVSSDPITKRIAEINRHKKIISIQKEGYWIHELGILLPKRKCDFILQPYFFDLFLMIPKRLQGKYEVTANRIFLVFDDVRIEITSKSELHIVREVFVEKCYQFVLPHDEPVHVIDIGMNVGIASLFFAGLSYVKKVHAYEPFVRSFVQAQNNFRLNPNRQEKIATYNLGLGLTKADVPATYNVDNPGTNTILGSADGSVNSSREILQIESAYECIYALLDCYPAEKFIMKIDTEGAEYLIFESLFKKKLSEQVKGIMLEWHFKGSKELEDALLRNDFKLASFQLDASSGLIYAFR